MDTQGAGTASAGGCGTIVSNEEISAKTITKFFKLEEAIIEFLITLRSFRPESGLLASRKIVGGEAGDTPIKAN